MIAFVLAALLAAAPRPALAQASRPTVDTLTSKAVTDYLNKHRLPLVGATVTVDRYGTKQLMLYGYVATSFGKTDAEHRARHFLKQPGIRVVNRIEVRPEILHLKHRNATAESTQPGAPEATAPEGVPKDSWNQIMRDIQKGGATTAPEETAPNLP
jgi:hypothetical protein